MKPKTDADGYESGGPLMWGWRISNLLPKPMAFLPKPSIQRATIELDSNHMARLEREAARRQTPVGKFMSDILYAQAETLQ